MYGRDKDLAKLKQWLIDDRCRLVTMQGIGGIGKTALAAKLVEQIKDEFEFVFWRTLQNAPPLEGILKNCIQFLSFQRRIELPGDIEGQIALLLRCLQERRCLLVLDNLETILQAGDSSGHYRDGYAEYGKLLRSIGETKHQSCLLLTSREKLKEVALFEGKASPVRSLLLPGLELIEGRELLKDKGIFGSDKAWADLISLYAGNPLDLKLVAEPIQELFRGDIASFLKRGKAVFGDIRAPLDLQFTRLSDLEREIMYWLAIEREAVSLDDLRENMVFPPLEGDLLVAMGSLRRRSMVESSSIGHFALQPVIMEYVIDRFVENISEEIKTQIIRLLGSHALMKAQAVDYLRESQVRLILTPVSERLLRSLSRDAIEKKLKNILSTLRKTELQKPNYTAGNVLNLLVKLGCNLRGYDFSHLTIWQAYLQEVSLPEVNFTEADLAKSVFIETFGGVVSVAFSALGRLMAIGTADGEIRLSQADNGISLLSWRGHLDWINSVAFSPDGKTLASGSDDQSVRLWDTSTGQLLKRLQGHNGRVWSVAFSPDGRTLASGSDDQSVRLWDTSTGQLLKILEGHTSWVWSVAFSPDGRTLASGDEDQNVRLWDSGTGKLLRIIQGHTSRVYAVAFSQGGRMLASGSDDQSVRLWDVSTGQLLKILEGHTGSVRSVVFSPNGEILASGSDDQSACLWDVSTGQLLKILEGHSNQVNSVAFNANGGTLASGSDDQSVRLWDTSTGQLLKTIRGHTSRVWSVSFSPDGRMIASGNEDRSLRLWDTSTGRLLKTIRGHTSRVWSVSFSPDGRTLASGSEDRSLRLWDTSTGRLLMMFQGHNGRVWSVSFSPNGEMLASGSDDQSVRLWDVSTGQLLKILEGHTSWVYSVIFCSGGKMLASGSEDRSLRLWDISTGQLLKVFQGHNGRVYSVAFSPDGRTLVSGSEDRSLRLWDISTGQLLKVFQGHNGRVWSVSFSPDGRMLASGSEDRSLRLWDISTGQLLKTFQGHTSWVRSISFSPDGEILISGCNDGTIKLWHVHKDEAKCLTTLRIERPYENMKLMGVAGLTGSQLATLRSLGAITGEEPLSI